MISNYETAETPPFERSCTISAPNEETATKLLEITTENYSTVLRVKRITHFTHSPFFSAEGLPACQSPRALPPPQTMPPNGVKNHPTDMAILLRHDENDDGPVEMMEWDAFSLESKTRVAG